MAWTRPCTSTEPRFILRRNRYRVMRDLGIPSARAHWASGGGARFALVLREHGHDPEKYPEMSEVRNGGVRSVKGELRAAEARVRELEAERDELRRERDVAVKAYRQATIEINELETQVAELEAQQAER